MGVISNIIEDNKFTPDHLDWFDAKLFFEGVSRRRNYEQFSVLLLLATTIATYGVLGDSTATVIGAMIIAPLMTPIMATAAALVTGRFDRAWRSVALVAAGVAGVIGVSWLLAMLSVNTVISVETNSQIAGRISPRLIDLAAALASGAAGAFALSRRDVSDSLPGVAIAISLVPPLCVVGITLSVGEFNAAMGALLLFITNFLSILLAGGGVLALLGLGAAATKELRRHARRRAFLFIALGAVIVAIPLLTTSVRVARQSITEATSKNLAQQWVDGTDYRVSRVVSIGDEIYVVVNGSGDVPDLETLGADINQAIGRLVTVRLTIIPTQEQVYSLSSP